MKESPAIQSTENASAGLFGNINQQADYCRIFPKIRLDSFFLTMLTFLPVKSSFLTADEIGRFRGPCTTRG
jgi:hypothetical protein